MKRNMLENRPQIEKQKNNCIFHPKWNYHFQKPNYHNQRTEVGFKQRDLETHYFETTPRDPYLDIVCLYIYIYKYLLVD